MISGRVTTVSTGLTMALTIPSTAAPIRYAAQPWMRTPSQRAFAAHRAAALTAHAIATRMTNGTQRV